MTTESQVFRPFTPRREWLLRCQDSDRELAVCAIEASDGEIGVTGPEGEFFSLEACNIAEFRDALTAAITQAERDVLDNRRPD